VRAVEDSQETLHLLGNIDEAVRRVLAVWHSNDPVARALSLRMLVCIARIAPERKDIHHWYVDSVHLLLKVR
jgi:hypothetical protein